MAYTFKVSVFYKNGIYDPAAQTTFNTLKRMGLEDVSSLRMGKVFEISVDGADESLAHSQIEKACRDLLVNPVMESFNIEKIG